MEKMRKEMKRMQLRKWSVVLLALLLAAMAMVPMVSAAEKIDVSKIPVPELRQDSAQKNTVITAAFSTREGEDQYKIPTASIIYHSPDGITKVFSQNGKQILTASDETATKVPTPNGLQPATHVHAVPQGAIILDSPKFKNTTYVLNENGDLVMIVIDDSAGKISGVTRASTLYGSNWLAWASSTVSQISYLRTTWYTPTPPSTSGGTPGFALAIFNGLQNSGTILQPVLEWNYGLNNPVWKISSWRYSSPSSYYYSPMLNVNQGDNIQGTLQYTTVGGSTGWQVTTSDLTQGTSTYYFSNVISTNTNLEIVNTLEQAQGQNSNPYQMCGDIVFNNANIPAVTLTKGSISSSGWSGLFNVWFSPNPTLVTIDTP
jgi:hypothetical protein